MKMSRCRPVVAEDLWTLENRVATIGLERRTGILRSIVWRRQGVDLMQQTPGNIGAYAGYLRVYDEEDRAWYSDLDTPFTISRAGKRGQTVQFTKQFHGAPFSLTVILRMQDDGLLWQVEARKKNRKVSNRSLRVHFVLPLIAGWDVWAPCRFGETTFDGTTPFDFQYTQIPYVSDQEVILPMVSHYHRGEDVGFSVVEPIDANVPAAHFANNNADKCFAWGSMHRDMRDVPVLETVNYFIGLVGDRPMKTAIHVLFHGGDWRPGLGLVYERWQAFFDPFNDAIYDREGVFQCGGVQNANSLKEMLAMGVKTFEVHGHFQDYCDYYQDGKDRWLTINTKETLRRALLADRGADSKQGWLQAKENRQKGLPAHANCMSGEVERWLSEHSETELAAKLGRTEKDLFHTRADVKKRLQKMTDAGISCHWYFNYTDGYRPRVEAEWPDSISRDEDGNPIPSGWYMCHNMNADPRYSFGKFCYESARKIFDAYPMLDGFFLDCFRHYEIDFAHDDGVTVVNGKPCYSINRSYDDIERLIKTRIMKPRNLTSFANKPMSIRSMRYCDGQLLEGNGDTYEEKFFWASIASPMFYMWTRGDASVDEFLRRAVLHGCYPRNAPPTPENLALYRRYLPLYAQFQRRVFCFEPDPLRVPKGSRGKLYTVPSGYVASIVNVDVDESDQVRWGKTPYALFRVVCGHDVASVGILYPGDRRPRKTPFKFDGTFLAVPMPGYKNCAVVTLAVGRRSGRRIGADTFTQRSRMCGDPESAFEDISVR